MRRFLLYQAACWAVVLLLTWGLPAWAPLLVVLLALYATLPVLALVRWRGWPFYPGALFRLLVVRGVLYVQLLLPLAAATGAAGLLVGLATGAPFATGRIAAVAALGAAALLLLAGFVGSHRLTVRHADVLLPELPRALHGLRIVQVSDLHVGPHTARWFLRRVKRAVERARGDLVVVTGDLVDDRSEDVAAYAAAFGDLRAPLGVFAVPGNHDVYAGWDATEAALRRSTRHVPLVNEARILERDGARLAIVGLGDPAGGSRWRDPEGGTSRAAPDPERSFRHVPEGVPVVALAHNPVLWPLLARRGVALTLSGHTHWGQFAIPRISWSLATPFLEHAMGAHRLNQALLYINPGTGYWGVPFRLGALPEVTVLTLREGEPADIVMV